MSSSHTAQPPTQETTPLLAGEDRSVHEDADVSADVTAGQDESASSQSPRTVYRSLSRIDKFLARSLLAVVVTSIAQLAFSLPFLIMTGYGYSHYDLYDYYLEGTLSIFFWTIICCGIVAVFDLVRLRRRGRPGYALVNALAFGLGAIVLLCVAGQSIVDKAYRMGWEVCNDDHYSRSGCRRWARQYMVVTWFYLVLAFIVGLEFLTLFIAVLVKAFKERSQSAPSSSTFNIPAGFVAFEVRVKWGNPQSEGSSGNNAVASTASASAPTRQDEGATQV